VRPSDWLMSPYATDRDTRAAFFEAKSELPAAFACYIMIHGPKVQAGDQLLYSTEERMGSGHCHNLRGK